MNIKVAVRVRPFSHKEAQVESKLCVEMNGATTRLYDHEEPQKVREFTFDHCFWSHDGFTKNEQECLIPSNDKFVDQKGVFDKSGVEMVESVFEGYNSSLLAYGQTGAGKTFTMMGSECDKGILPRVCEQIIRTTQSNKNSQRSYQIHVSMLEIYNQRLQDLLVPLKERKKQGIRIRQHKTRGIYIEGISKQQVTANNTFQQIIKQGYNNQCIAATFMGMAISRACTIVVVELKQVQVSEGEKEEKGEAEKEEKLSVLHFVDLPGSQKLGKTSMTGQSLKEAASLGKLSVLLNVFTALSDNMTDKSKKRVVPYRDSCLTRLMQNSFGGNSKTSMICLISPATSNHHETLSTLRYAVAARKVINKPITNQWKHQDQLIFKEMVREKEKIQENTQEIHESMHVIINIQQMSAMQQTKLKQFEQELSDKMCDLKEKIETEQYKKKCDTESQKIKVAVRVRPFSQRQNEVQSKLCIEMNETATYLYDPKSKQTIREFRFDHSLWSHSEHIQSQQGQFKRKSADQGQVFETVGREMVDSMMKGYNCSIIGYGQTGAGKTYTMFGRQENEVGIENYVQGMIPRVVRQIIARIDESEEKGRFYKVNASIFEVYNQRMTDLLNPVTNQPKPERLKISTFKLQSQHITDLIICPKTNSPKQLHISTNNPNLTSILNLTKHQITPTNTFSQLLQQAFKNQNLARTQLSYTPTNLQTVVQVELIQEELGQDGITRQRVTVGKFVQLGGSENQSRFQSNRAQGDRLSLELEQFQSRFLAFRNVVKVLSAKTSATQSNHNPIIPYQNSIMTQYLQDVLGGIYRTAIVFVVSPAFGNYDETLKTLQCAELAMKIVNKPKINQWTIRKSENNQESKEKIKQKLIIS